MVAIFTGVGTGFERGSASVLGASGLLGGASLGRSGDQIFLNAATGNLLVSQRDEFLVGQGPDATISRVYNSLGETAGDEADHGGDLWRMASERRIINVSATIDSGAASGGQVKRVSGDGSIITYTWDASRSAYIATDGAGTYDKLTCSGNVWTWTDGDSQWTEKYESYSSYWRITEYRDTEIGSVNKLTFTYHSGSDRLYRVTTTDGGYVQYEWDGSNRLSQLVTGYTDLVANQAKTLTRTRYGYDSSNRLSTVTVDLSPENNSIADGKTYVTTYAYDGSSNRILSISQSDGSKLAVGYTLIDTVYRVTSMTQTVSTGVTRTTAISYGSDANGTYTDVTDAANQVTRLRYDSEKRLTKIIAPTLQEVSFTYDSEGDLRSVIDQSGHATAYTHDSNGNIETITDRLNNVTTRTYGSKNELLRETRIGSNAASASAAHTTRYIYDIENHLRFVVSAEGHVTEYRAWPPGEPSYTIEYPGDPYDVSALAESVLLTETDMNTWLNGLSNKSSAQITKNFYDARGNLVSSYRFATANTNGTESTAEVFEFVSYVYDQAGQLRSRTSQGQGTESFIYDGMGRIVASTDAGGATTRYTFQDAATTTIVTLTDGTVQTSTYNKAGELLSTTESASSTRSANLAPDLSNLSQWTRSGATVAGAGQDSSGASAYTYTVQTTGTPGSINTSQTVAAGETVTLEITLKAADATSQLHRFGILSGITAWEGELEVTVLSGPGQVARHWPTWALWEITGLSTTQETRIRFSRTFATADTAYVASWVSHTSSLAQAGDKVILSNPVLTKTTPHVNSQPTPASLAPDLSNLSQWTRSGATVAGAGQDSSGASAYTYTVQTTGTPGSINTSQTVAAGETVTLEITLKAADATSQLHRFGILSGITAWEGELEVTVLSGPGQVARHWPTWALWEITGLSTTQETRIRFSRTFATADTAYVASWVSHTSSLAQAGDKIILSNPVLTKTAPHKYDSLGRLRVSIDASGVSTYYYYDAIGRKTAEIGGDGRTYREFRYDANNRLVATLHSVNASPKQGLFLNTSGNLTEYSLSAMRPDAHASDVWEWRVYDKEDRLVRTVAGDGSVQKLIYDASGRLIETIAFANKLSAATIDGYETTAPALSPETLPTSSTNDVVTRLFYDKDGRLLGVRDGAGYLTRTYYDKAGRKISEVAYATATSATGTLNAITPLPSNADRYVRYAYNGRGLLRFQIDNLNQVVEFAYNAAGQVTQTIAYAGAIGATSDYSYANVKALIMSGNLAANGANRQSWSVYDPHGRLAYAIDAENAVTQVRYDHAGRATTSIAFNALRATASLPSYATMQSWAAGQASAITNRISRSFYDVNGDLAYTVNAEGYAVGYAYDAENRLTRTRAYSVQTNLTDASTLANLETAVAAGTYIETRQEYDVAGRLAAGYDGENYKTTYGYFGTDQVAFTIYGDGSSAQTRTEYSYDAAGRLASVIDAAGTSIAASITHHYSGLGDLIRTVDQDGNSTRFYYDQLGRQVRTRDAENHVTETSYTAFGQVARVTQRANQTTSAQDDFVLPTVAANPAEDSSTYFYYDAVGRNIMVRDGEDQITETTFSAFGDVTSTIRRANETASSISETTLPTVIANAGLDAVTFYYHDRLGRVVKSADAELYITQTGQTTFVVTETSYTAFGQIEQVTRRYNRASNTPSLTVQPEVTNDPTRDATTIFEYYRTGSLKKATDALEGYEQYTLDAFGNRVSVRNKLGGNTVNTFDKRGLLLSETLPMSSWTNAGIEVATTILNTFTYDARGNRTTMVEASGRTEQRTTTYVYDKLDRLVEQAGQQVATGTVGTLVIPKTSFKYDARGNVIETIDPNNARTLFYYDKLNRKKVEIGATGTYSTFAYDANGNVTLSRVYATPVTLPTNAGGTPPGVPSGSSRATNFTYDNLNRLETSYVTGVLVGESNTGGTAWTSGSGPVTLTTTYAYDANGNLVSTTDPEGGVSYNYYDKAGRRTASVDAELYLTTWTHDAEGNVLSERRYWTKASGAGLTAPPTIATDTKDRVTNFTYDKNGNRLTESRLNVVYSVDLGSGELTPATATSTIAYEYNLAGQVKKKTEATGEAVEYQYDNAGRLERETRAAFYEYGNTTTLIRPVVKYLYDGLNNVVRTVQTRDTGGTERVTRSEYGIGGRLTKTIDATNNERSYMYDAAGNVVAEKWARTDGANGTVDERVVYLRDLLGQVTRQTLERFAGSTWTAAGDYVHTVYNAYGEVAARGTNRDTSHQELFIYDNAGRLTGTNSGDGVWRHFGYDGAGRQTLVVESEGGNLANLTFEQVLSPTFVGNAIGGAHQDYYTVTVNTFDKRGQMLQSNMLQRELATVGAGTRLYTERTYNAFGEVINERDARGNTTSFSHNTMGRTLQVTRPNVDVLSVTDVTTNEAPVEELFYDLSGRLIGSEDANNNRTTRSLLAGTGYGGAEALVLKEFHADDGVKTHAYSAFGDLRLIDDELDGAPARDVVMEYDAMGRVTKIIHSNTLEETIGYDQLGQQVSRANSLFVSQHGSTAGTQITAYDIMGRVRQQVAYGGDTTSLVTTWNNSLSSGAGSFGGWVTVTTYANTLTSSVTADQFGHQLAKTDMGGHSWTMTYDLAGRMTGRTGQDTMDWSYLNTGLVRTIIGNGYSAAYEYDATGLRLKEQLSRSGTVYQNAVVEFDALGRMTRWEEIGNTTAPAALLKYFYDKQGNIRKTEATYHQLDASGAPIALPTGHQPDTYWYRYDAMNRVVTAKGELVGGTVARGYGGTDYTYNAAGQRTSATTNDGWLTKRMWRHQPQYGMATWHAERDYDIYGGSWSQADYTYPGVRTESYTYDAGGALATVSSSQTDAVPNGGPYPDLTGMTWPVLTASYINDFAGRATGQIDYVSGTSNAAYSRTVTFNASGQLASESISTRQSASVTITNAITHTYGTVGTTGYGLGAVVTTTNYETGGSTSTTATTTNTLGWWDGAVTTASTYAKTGQTTVYSTYGYGAAGTLDTVAAGTKTVTFTNDVNGQVIRRDELASGSGNAPHEVWYRYGGKELISSSNNGTQDTNYRDSIAARTALAGTGPFRGGDTGPTQYVDFDQSLRSINSYHQGGAGGSYEVRAGDTLAGIAANLWGDSALWYKLAEANGLGAGGALVAGQRITIPSGVMKNTHNASTFKPYDPSEVIGDLGPAPSPQSAKKNKCGAFGAILIAAVAVAVTIVTSGAALAAIAPASAGIGASIGAGISAMAAGVTSSITGGMLITAGMIGGAVGSIVSQGVGVATGVQEKFDWKGVAMSAIAGGVSAGLGAAMPSDLLKSTFLANVARGAASSLVTQGIGVVTGLQAKFDWTGVVAAGFGAGVAGGVTRELVGQGATPFSIDAALESGVGSMAGAIANGAARSLIDGTSFGDNVLAALPDVIGNTIGNMIAGAVQRADAKESTAEHNGIGGPELTPEEARQLALEQFFNAPESGTSLQYLSTLDNDQWEQPVLEGYGTAWLLAMLGESDVPADPVKRIREILDQRPDALEGIARNLVSEHVESDILGAKLGNAADTLDRLRAHPELGDVFAEIGRPVRRASDFIRQDMDRSILKELARGLRAYVQIGGSINLPLAAVDYVWGVSEGSIKPEEAFARLAGLARGFLGRANGAANALGGGGSGGSGGGGGSGSGGVVGPGGGDARLAAPNKPNRALFDLPDDLPIAPGAGGAARPWTIGSRLRAAGGEGVGLPRRGRFRFMPREGYDPRNALPRTPDGRAIVDRFGNQWRLGASRTKGEPYEWDVTLSRRGQAAWGRHTRPGTEHVNVSLRGRLTHGGR